LDDSIDAAAVRSQTFTQIPRARVLDASIHLRRDTLR
jgi:hypothetical protein